MPNMRRSGGYKLGFRRTIAALVAVAVVTSTFAHAAAGAIETCRVGDACQLSPSDVAPAPVSAAPCCAVTHGSPACEPVPAAADPKQDESDGQRPGPTSDCCGGAAACCAMSPRVSDARPVLPVASELAPAFSPVPVPSGPPGLAAPDSIFHPPKA